MNISETLNFELVSISGRVVTVGGVLTGLAVMLIGFVAARVVDGMLRRAFLRRQPDSPHAFGGARRLLRWIFDISSVAMGLHLMGIELGALFAAGAIFAVGLGFAMQNIAQNFVSGIILLVERTIKPGDIIAVEGSMVRVVEMGIRATVARTRQEEELIIPNSTLVSSTVKNYALRDPVLRIKVPVGVTYDSDMRLVEKTLADVAEEQSGEAPPRPPVILLEDFGDSAVVWETSIFIDKPWEERTRKSDLRKAIWWALHDAGIVIAFPQVDVHFDRPVVSALQSLHGASKPTAPQEASA